MKTHSSHFPTFRKALHSAVWVLTLLGSLEGQGQALGVVAQQDFSTGASSSSYIGYAGAITLSNSFLHLDVTNNGRPVAGKYYSITSSATSNTVAWVLNNPGGGIRTETVVFDNILFNPGATNKVEFLLAAMSDNPQNGNGLQDGVQILISTDLGATFRLVATITGNHDNVNGPGGYKNGVVWGYAGNDIAPGSLTASTTFDALAPTTTATTFTPTLAPSISPNSPQATLTGAGGFGKVSIGLVNATNIQVKVILLNNAANRIWGIDNFRVLSTGPITLPVELTQFSALAKGQGVAVDWTTATEQNNDRFEVQRSPDGRIFSTIATVPGQGNSSIKHRYSSFDPTPLPGQTYYRLRQVDFDGKTSFSPVAAVRWHGTTDAAVMLSVHPNPSAGILRLSGAGNTGFYRILNSLGQPILQGETAGTIDVQKLQAGTYLLEMARVSGRRAHRFVRE